MAENNRYELKIQIGHNLLRCLPEKARDKLSPEFSNEITDIMRKLFKELGGVISVMTIGKEEIRIIWKSDSPGVQPFEGIIRLLNRGSYKEAILLLELFKSAEPDNIDLLYNLGMAYSDLSELNSAQINLQRLLEIDPTHVNGRVALGVALMRNKKEEAALKELRTAIEQEPKNPWAQRNIGACYLRLGRNKYALTHLKLATEYNPEDERSWYGLGQAYEANDMLNAADEAYRKVLEINEFGEIAEQAKQGLSSIAEKTFKRVTQQEPRMDAVMYCLGALEKFEKMPKDDVRRIGFEVAMVGMRGIEANKPEKQYTINSLPGKFSGLHLLCLEYVAFTIIDPDMDIGFDLSKEYEMALNLYNQKKERS
ncbi:MAG: tetratricopeptide repeat protein [Candidatus Helarchaeota archaeon]